MCSRNGKMTSGWTNEGRLKMTAYVIGHINIRDTAKWEEYRSQVPNTLKPWGGEVVLRGHKITMLNGIHNYGDTVVLRFPDADSASGWHESPAYQSLVPLRSQAADVVLISYQSNA
jgi:uncharacterized protein (DUF1330 family)